jgi:hypothetical protein
MDPKRISIEIAARMMALVRPKTKPPAILAAIVAAVSPMIT